MKEKSELSVLVQEDIHLDSQEITFSQLRVVHKHVEVCFISHLVKSEKNISSFPRRPSTALRPGLQSCIQHRPRLL